MGESLSGAGHGAAALGPPECSKGRTPRTFRTLLARRSLLLSLGGFDSSYVAGSDSDWLFRAADAGVLRRSCPLSSSTVGSMETTVPRTDLRRS